MNEIIEPNEQAEQIETAEKTEAVETPTAEPTEAEEAKEVEKEEVADDMPTKSELAKAKNELKEEGMGGAAFCDELLRVCPSVLERLKQNGKTLHGLYNYAYSLALHEYVKKNGRVNGGGFWNLSVLAEKYLDPSVKEGDTVKDPKAKPDPKPKTAPTKEAIVKTAKKAAAVAKKEKDENMTFDFGF